MNLPNCPTHGDRKQQLICLTDGCQDKFQPKCVQCMMTSKCRASHTWKMISQTIQEILEACENRQIREQRKSSRDKKPPANELHQKHIELTIRQMKSRIDEIRQEMIDNIEKKAKKLLSKMGSPIGNHSKVKQMLRMAKKESDQDKFRSKIKSIGQFMTCLNDGAINLIEGETQTQIEDIEISIFQNQSNQMLEAVSSSIYLSGQLPQHIAASNKKYQTQIDNLLNQLKQLPVLQNRIQSLTEKLQIKQAKIKKLEGQTSQIRQDLGPKKNSSIQQIQKMNKRSIARVQSLVKRRQQLFNAFQQYSQKNPQQDLYLYNLKPGVNAVKLQIPSSNNTTYLLNMNSLSICDQLQYHNYSDDTTGQDNIEVPLICAKKQKPKPKTQQIDINPLLLLLMGLR